MLHSCIRSSHCIIGYNFEDVELQNKTAANSSIETSWRFAEMSMGQSNAMIEFTMNVGLSFDIGQYINRMPNLCIGFRDFDVLKL